MTDLPKQNATIELASAPIDSTAADSERSKIINAEVPPHSVAFIDSNSKHQHDAGSSELASGPEDSQYEQHGAMRYSLAEIPHIGRILSFHSTEDVEHPEQDAGSIELASGPEDWQYEQHGARRYSLAEIPDIRHTLSFHSTEDVEHPTVTEPAIQLYENKLTVFASLVPVSIVGTLIRLELTLLETYNGSPVFALAYPQFIGCLIMGIAVKKKDFLLKRFLPLQIAMSTGLCGSITTFSSWQLGIFEAFSNYGGASHSTGYNVLAGLTQVLVTLAVSMCGLTFGYHIAYCLDHIVTHHLARKFDTRNYSITPVGYKLTSNPKDILTVLAGTLSWVAVIVVSATVTSQRQLSLALVFAPLGTLTRWWLSRFNTRMAGFPLGTFIANIFATLVLAVVTLLMSGETSSSAGCNVLQAVADGYCGCLSTISTFTVEITNLKLRAAYKYTLISVILGQIIMFVVLGTYIWTTSVWTPGVQGSCTF